MTTSINEPNLKGILVRCPNPNCEYTWRYLGRFFYYATCPSCRKNVKIQDNKVESLQSTELGGHNRLQRPQHCPAITKKGEQVP